MSRVAGIGTTSGVKAGLHGDHLPTKKELAELNQRLSGSNRRSRTGLPGRRPTEEFIDRLECRLRTAAKRGRGLHFISRDELDAVVGQWKTNPKRTNAEKREQVTQALATIGPLSTRIISNLCGVSHMMVSRMRRQLEQVTVATIGHDGKTRRMPKRS